MTSLLRERDFCPASEANPPSVDGAIANPSKFCREVDIGNPWCHDDGFMIGQVTAAVGILAASLGSYLWAACQELAS